MNHNTCGTRVVERSWTASGWKHQQSQETERIRWCSVRWTSFAENSQNHSWLRDAEDHDSREFSREKTTVSPERYHFAQVLQQHALLDRVSFLFTGCLYFPGRHSPGFLSFCGSAAGYLGCFQTSLATFDKAFTVRNPSQRKDYTRN